MSLSIFEGNKKDVNIAIAANGIAWLQLGQARTEKKTCTVWFLSEWLTTGGMVDLDSQISSNSDQIESSTNS